VDKVTCVHFDGGHVDVPRNEIRFRPGAYAVIVHEGRLLLVWHENGKFFFPGGGQKAGETIYDTVRRKVLEETGYQVRIVDRVDFREMYLYHSPSKEAWHCHQFFCRCELLTDPNMEPKGVNGQKSGHPVWIETSVLKPELFLNIGGPVFQRLKFIKAI
jgi:8-oxo-dGTP pyrophosphatase MutT (NUDIX family)